MSTFSTSRLFAASPAALFAAIENPLRLARWWGPDGFSNRFEVFEFKTGGRWVFDMIGPDGTVYANESVFTTVETDRQVVIAHVCEPRFVLTVTLSPTDTGTLVRWDQTFADAAVADAVRAIVEPANEQNLNRLEAELLR